MARIRIIFAFLIVSLIPTCSYAIPIYCPDEEIKLYDYEKEVVEGEEVMAEDFKPVEGIPQPKDTDEFVCPKCGCQLNGWKWFFIKNNLKMPLFVFPAFNMLTKDKDGFKWVPYDLPCLQEEIGE